MTIPQLPSEAHAVPKQTFQASYWPILLDYSLRWALVGLLRLCWVNSLAFWSINVALGLVFTIFLVNRDEAIKKRYNLKTVSTPENSTLPVLMWLVAALSGAWVSTELYGGWPLWQRLSLGLAVLVLYGIYLTILAMTTKSRSREDLKKEAEALAHVTADEIGEPIDLNDQRIVRMEAEISSISRRVEAYTLESTLFGALSFSGFVTLVASDRVAQSDFTSLTSAAAGLLSRLLHAQLGNSMLDLKSSEKLALIAVETLFCSVFFVLAIVSRLRFYETMRRVDYAVRRARAFNEKEEEVNSLHPQQATQVIERSRRLEAMSKGVADAIGHAEPLFSDLLFAVHHMQLFRNMGLFIFLLILVTSAFSVSVNLGLALAALVMLAMVFAGINRLLRERIVQQLPFFSVLEQIYRISGKLRRPVP